MKSYGKDNKFVTIVASIEEDAAIVEHIGEGMGKDGLKDYWRKFEKEGQVFFEEWYSWAIRS